jgi:hypothetical protein
VNDEFRFYKDTNPETAGDRKIMARRERGGAGLCYFGNTLKDVRAKVADRIAQEAAWAAPAAPAARKPLLNAKARKARLDVETIDG